MTLFWLLSFAIAWAISLPPALERMGIIEFSPIPSGAGILIGIAPIVAAAVAAAREGQGKAYWGSLRRPPRPIWAAFAILLPPLLLAFGYGVHVVVGTPIEVTFAGMEGYAVLWLVLAFTEEAGWRAYALPRLVERYGFWRAGLLLGIFWCFWHYPKLLGSPYLGSLAEAIPLIALFSLQIVLANFIICWLFFRSGRSTIATTLFHASFNLIATAYFAAATDVIITGALAVGVAAIALRSVTSEDHIAPGST